MSKLSLSSARRSRFLRSGTGDLPAGGGGGPGGGPPGPFNLLDQGDTAPSGSFATASVSPTADALVFIVMILRTPSAVPTASGCGITWVDSSGGLALIGGGGTPRYLCVLSGKSASPTTGAITVSTDAAYALWHVIEVENGEIVQRLDGTGGTSKTVTLAAFEPDSWTLGVSGGYNEIATIDGAHTALTSRDVGGGEQMYTRLGYVAGEDLSFTYTAQFFSTSFALIGYEIGGP